MKDTKMKCTEIRELLPDLAAGVTSTATEVNAHLRSCTEESRLKFSQEQR